MIDAYPLQWPTAWPRTKQPLVAQFKTSLTSAARNLTWELERLGAKNIVISSNMQYRADGIPYSRQPNLADTGIAVYFTLNGEEQCIPCDKWTDLADNMQAIRKTVEALRGLERWRQGDGQRRLPWFQGATRERHRHAVHHSGLV